MASLLKLSQSFAKISLNASSKQLLKQVRYASIASNPKETLINVPPTQITTLNNGMRVATEDWGSQTATVGVWIDAGSRYENANNNGVAHFMEHMAFKGTNNRTQSQLEIEIEDMGAQLNAYTSREQTVYYCKCLSKDVPKAIEILADIIQNAKLSSQDIEKERGVILREMQEVESNLQEVVFDYLHSCGFQGTPLGNTILGPTKNIKSITSTDLRNYLSDHYKACRLVVAGAGGVAHDDLVKLTDKHFGKMSNEYPAEVPRWESCRFTGSELRHRDDSLPLAHVAFAVEGAGWGDPDTLALMVASTLLGAWDRSQAGGKQNATVLARTCAEEDLCHSFQSFNTCYKDTGLWGIYYVADGMKLEDMTCAAQYEMIRMTTSATEGEVERGKALLIANTLLQLDTTTAVCEDIGRQVLCYGRRIPPHELIHRIQSITAQQLREVCYKYLYDRCPALASIGPVEQLTDYNRFRGNMQWFRV